MSAMIESPRIGGRLDHLRLSDIGLLAGRIPVCGNLGAFGVEALHLPTIDKNLVAPIVSLRKGTISRADQNQPLLGRRQKVSGLCSCVSS